MRSSFWGAPAHVTTCKRYSMCTCAFPVVNLDQPRTVTDDVLHPVTPVQSMQRELQGPAARHVSCVHRLGPPPPQHTQAHKHAHNAQVQIPCRSDPSLRLAARGAIPWLWMTGLAGWVGHELMPPCPWPPLHPPPVVQRPCPCPPASWPACAAAQRRAATTGRGKPPAPAVCVLGGGHGVRGGGRGGGGGGDGDQRPAADGVRGSGWPGLAR